MTRQSDSDADRDPADGWFSDLSSNRLVWITAFVVLFTIVGTLAPTYYYNYSPSDQFLSVHSATVPEQDVNTTAVDVSIDRTAKRTYSGVLVVELSRIREGNVQRITASRFSVVIEEGRQTTILAIPTPALPPGDYQLSISGEITLPHGVERRFAWEPTTFIVSSNETRLPDPTPATQTATPPANQTANTSETA